MLRTIYCTGFAVCFSVIMFYLESKRENGTAKRTLAEKITLIIVEIGVSITFALLWEILVLTILGAVILNVIGEDNE